MLARLRVLTPVVCALVVLSLFTGAAMSLVHLETGEHGLGAPVYAHDASDDLAVQPPGETPPGGDTSDGAPGDRQQGDGDHHHLIDVDAGVLRSASVGVPLPVVQARSVDPESLPAAWADGGGRPD